MRHRAQIVEELLVLQAQDGERGAIERLAGLYHHRLLRLAVRMVGPAQADDIVQEAWVGVLRALPRLRDPARFRPWAFRIVANKCRDAIRRNQRLRLHEEALESNTDQLSASSGNSGSEALEDLRRAVRGLPRDQRLVLDLYYLEGLGIGEIADALGVPRGTVKSRLFHARRRLRSQLQPSQPVCEVRSRES